MSVTLFWTKVLLLDHVLLFSDQAVTFGQNTDSRNLGLAVHQHTELFLDPFLCLFAPFKTNKQTLYVLAFLFPLVALPVQYFSGTRLTLCYILYVTSDVQSLILNMFSIQSLLKLLSNAFSTAQLLTRLAI